MEVHAIKTGMLYDSDTVKTVCETLGSSPSVPLIVDPVCVSTSGHTLLEPDAIGTIIDSLLPLATIITPNWFEME